PSHPRPLTTSRRPPRGRAGRGDREGEVISGRQASLTLAIVLLRLVELMMEVIPLRVVVRGALRERLEFAHLEMVDGMDLPDRNPLGIRLDVVRSRTGRMAGVEEQVPGDTHGPVGDLPQHVGVPNVGTIVRAHLCGHAHAGNLRRVAYQIDVDIVVLLVGAMAVDRLA